ncbi:MAG: Lipid-A-disaccharide synthase [Candidatus Ozemobacter sibiricus]|jgi:lipid-A-disaccharide synthase|uniref:Lipid-A-disaccharide synthase n=1 Tax=Candidatus Ozemobacter sibiricus TaxID=2268124 RepID=A0A367ZT13_9BACT|nr:MAG: Lipid-A-disaccharide synthase [Candidatus Ozemobacter sibiricus]
MNGAMFRKRVLIVAGETSGDIYASTLIDVLLRHMDLEIFAVGGPQTAKRPVKLLYDSSAWAAIGLIEAIKQAPRLMFVLRRLKRFLYHMRPDLVLLVDYPGFNMRLAREANHLGIPTLYYFPPSKFAVDPRDVADAARHITSVAANFSFTYKVYKKAGANVELVGHPLLDIARPTMSREEAFRQFGLDPARPVIALCPGSRRSELDQILPVMLEAGRLLRQRDPSFQFVVPVAVSDGPEVFGVSKAGLRKMLEESGLPIRLVEGKIYDVMNISRILLISSGTATLEATNIGTPMVITYRVSVVTEIVARLFYKLPEFIGLPNIILGRQAVPELIQWEFTPEKLADTAWEILQSPELYARQKRDLAEVVSHLGRPGAHERVARMAMHLLGEPMD